MVDGAQDRPPDDAADPSSRRERIRASAGLGPWRNGPRPATAAPVPPPASLVPPRPVVPAEAAPRPVAAPARPAPKGARPARRAGRGMVGWTVFGVAFAAGCVGLAFFFQPEGLPPEADAVAEFPPDTADTSLPVASVPPAPPQTADELAEADAAFVPAAADPAMPEAAVELAQISNVRVRTGTGVAEAEVPKVLVALAGAGLADVQAEALPFKVASSRVGYYRQEDRAAAEALAAFIAPVLGYGEPLPVRDYGALLDNAEPGRLDLWIGG